jgi:hypothetical protein
MEKCYVCIDRDMCLSTTIGGDVSQKNKRLKIGVVYGQKSTGSGEGPGKNYG